ncbi:FtsX-like permease family protein [Sphingomonas parva]|uniref:FtsX-like permease family protein n=2 Tax=Sphingomonas parva TaxID=2555898 RepID=A0A4Y8ZXK2_9SPHN|nr:FtsX-like permease family protein [Sphingomonas parva]TFI59569.1 FtsX-like permease family protein [Sphingomonas parva]
MPWVIAIMMFLTVLAAAAGLGLGTAASSLDEDTGTRATVQIVEPNPDRREAQARAALAVLEGQEGVESVRRIGSEEMEALLEPWLGPGGLEGDLPIPAMIEVDLSPAAYARLESLRAAVTEVAPSARVDDNAQWLAPLAGLIRALRWLAGALVLLMIGATAATVVLAARASLDTHRSTIEVLHLMGATDVQVARLFQRRIALDALFGGIVGLIAASLVLLVIGARVGALGSDLLGSAHLPVLSWAVLVALPVFGVALATVVARATILRALGRML